MRKFIFCFLLLSFFYVTQAQDARTLVREGVQLHDQGKFDEALLKYDAALTLDKNNYLAYYEKSYTLLAVKKYDESIELCKFILTNFKDGPENPSVYINYGTCLDLQGKPKEAIEIYNEGIKQFPKVGLLYFNKAVTMVNMGKTDEGLDAVKSSLLNSPYHASSHHILSILTSKQNKIYGLMGSLVFLAVEPESKRSAYHVANIQTILGGNVKKTGEKSVTVSIDQAILDRKNSEDDFSGIDLLMSMSAGLDFDDKYKDETQAERLERKLESVFAIMEETKDGKKGFGWSHYAPFFVKLKKEKHLKTFCRIVLASTDDASNKAWLNDNSRKVEEFNTWFKSYWKKS